MPPRPARRASFVVGACSLAVLLLTADYQIYDNNFYTLSEATAILAGEHPYRDFFEWGVPLQAYLSAAGQLVAGGRLIGEFGLQWLFITAGVVLAFRLALRLSPSYAAACVAMVPAILMLAPSPTYQYTKVFIYPCALVVGCRYLERPVPGRSAAMGAVIAIGFLFRHDHGIYVGLAVALVFLMAARAQPHLRRLRVAAAHLGVCAGICGLLIAPWLVTVATSEGLTQYVEARAYLRTAWSVQRPLLAPLLRMNPIRTLTPDPAVAADAEPYERLLAAWLPARGPALEWLYQVTMLVIVTTVAAGVIPYTRALIRGTPIPPRADYTLLTGLTLLLIAWELFREESYIVMTPPLVAACGAAFLAGPRGTSGPTRWAQQGRRAIAAVVFAITVIAAIGYARESNLPQLIYQAERLPRTLARLTVYPPIDGLITEAEARAIGPEEWAAADAGRRSDVMLRYVYECVAPGDHVLVSGPTPYQVGYYVQRPVAGGHVYWHDGWRSDPDREAQSLALLRRQSVPFAFSTDSPMLTDLARYPRIHEYIAARHRSIPGTGDRVLVDARRQPVRHFGRMRLPCFRQPKLD